MTDANLCPLCGSQRHRDEKYPDWMRCQNPRCRNLERVPPRKSTKSAKRTAHKGSHYGLGSVTIPDLDPPLPPGTIEDSEGAYEAQCRTYEAYQHFRERAGYYWEEGRKPATKKDKQAAGYRARLCENLAATLAQVYRHQTPSLLRKSLREQRAAGHAVGEKDRTTIALMKRYSLLMRQAISKLPDDPLVKAWRASREALGDYDYLRKAKKGLECGVQRPYASGQHALADLTVLDLATDGLSATKIRESLIKAGLPAPSIRTIQKRLKAYSLQISILPILPVQHRS